MTLRTKTLAAIGTMFVGLLALLHFSSREILLRTFGELEQRSVRRDVQRGTDALQNAVLGIYSKNADWANWDDAYEFVETHDPAFVTSNLTPKSLVDLQIDLLVLVDLSGQVIGGLAVDYRTENGVEKALPEGFREGHAPDPLVLQPDSGDEGLNGIYMLPEGPMLLAARPIRNSNGQGPTRGTVIMGRFLDSGEVARLSGLTHLCLVVRRLDDSSMPAVFRAADVAISDARPILVQPADADSVLGYTRLADMSGRPALLLQVVVPREIYQHGLLSVNSLFVAVAIVGLAFGGLTILLVERLVLARLARLSAGVREIGAKSDFSARLPIAGADELSRLASTVNGLLTAVETSEQALSESQRSLKTLMSNLPGMAYRCRNDRDWTMEFASEGCLELTGYHSRELTGGGKVTFGQLIHPEDRQHIWNDVQDALSEKRPFRLNYRIASAAGEEKWVWEQGRGILAPTGELQALEGLIVDITDRKRVEAELRQAREAAQAASAAKSEFLASISHELRTPMTAILGYVELLAEGCPRGCEFGRTALLPHTQTIARNAKHLLQLINDLLDLSKVEADKLQPEIVSCSPLELLADVESLMRVPALAKGLTLTIACASPIPEKIRTDPARLRQILINLLGNALKFTETGGVRLVVRLRQTEEEGGAAGPCLQFNVIDTGIGMTPAQIARLFRPFTQADGSITRRFGGTGLGLSISQRLAALLGGRITVESTPNVGSTFRLTVPTGPLDGVCLVQGAVAALPTPATKVANDAALAGQVLLAEDGPDNQRLISLVLRRAGAAVTVVENGQLAVNAALAALAAGTPFDVILMDMQMPVMDGFAATLSLRKEGYTGRIVALTAHAMASDRSDCLAAGCDDFASKPINRSNLITLVAKYLHEARAGSPTGDSTPAPPPTAPGPPIGEAAPAPNGSAPRAPDLAKRLHEFLTELPDTLSTLQRCVAAHDLANLGTLADAFKRSAGGCGLVSLTACAAKLAEAAHASAGVTTVNTLVRDLVSLCREAQLPPRRPAAPNPPNADRATAARADANPDDQAG